MSRAAGKYDAVLPGLPKLPEEPSYQEKIDKVKEEIGLQGSTFLAESYISLRNTKNELEEAEKRVNLRIAAYEQLLVESQEIGAAGWGEYGVKENALRLPTGATIRVQTEPYAQVKDKEAFRLWCLANGYERQLQLLWQTTNAIAKERLLDGKPEPDGCETFAKTKVVLAKAGEP